LRRMSAALSKKDSSWERVSFLRLDLTMGPEFLFVWLGYRGLAPT